MWNNNYLSLINFKVKTSSETFFNELAVCSNFTPSSLEKVSDNEVFTLKLIRLQ